MAQQFDLEERTLAFASGVRRFVKSLPKTIANQEDIRQLVRSSGSVGANYIEANEGLGEKDFKMKVKISRKEAKESKFWLRLLETLTNEQEKERQRLIQEATEFIYIFTAILKKFS